MCLWVARTERDMTAMNTIAENDSRISPFKCPFGKRDDQLHLEIESSLQSLSKELNLVEGCFPHMWRCVDHLQSGRGVGVSGARSHRQQQERRTCSAECDVSSRIWGAGLPLRVASSRVTQCPSHKTARTLVVTSGQT
ncbi:hypothetical protein CDAR_488501 [Caerostris darwini]|uniref:Uncharacterized protein n=1 Tax=Caerostris darwini TaxID=1538125 RepID=A0AAV4WK36_9ARAC|nr:hypothetical protein CDAR_488501 [Caerostris darwini]